MTHCDSDREKRMVDHVRRHHLNLPSRSIFLFWTVSTLLCMVMKMILVKWWHIFFVLWQQNLSGRLKLYNTESAVLMLRFRTLSTSLHVAQIRERTGHYFEYICSWWNHWTKSKYASYNKLVVNLWKTQFQNLNKGRWKITRNQQKQRTT